MAVHFVDDIFKQFLEWNYMNFAQDFIEICSAGPNQQYPRIGSDNSLAPTSQQAIIWSNVG